MPSFFHNSYHLTVDFPVHKIFLSKDLWCKSSWQGHPSTPCSVCSWMNEQTAPSLCPYQWSRLALERVSSHSCIVSRWVLSRKGFIKECMVKCKKLISPEMLESANSFHPSSPLLPHPADSHTTIFNTETMIPMNRIMMSVLLNFPLTTAMSKPLHGQRITYPASQCKMFKFLCECKNVQYNSLFTQEL